MKKLITFYFLIFTLSIPSPVSAWDVGSWAGVRKISGDLTVTGGLRTATSAGNTLLLQAYDVDGAAFTTFATLTANNTPTLDLATGVTIGSAYIYRVGGTDISLADGGTAASLTASTGGIFYSTATAGAILAGTATANQVLLSGSSAAPTWSTATYPASTTVNQLFYSSSANTLAGLATGNSGLLVTSGVGVPSIGTDIPTAVTIGAAYIYRAGGTDVSIADGGTGVGSWTNGQLLIGNTTGNTAALATLTGTANQIAVTNGAASITLATPQDLATTSTPQFARMGLGVAAHATDITSITSTNTTVDSKALNIAHTGAIAGDGYAGYFSKTGASTTNIAGYFSATGGTNNYGIIVANGSVGFGTTTFPTASTKVVVSDTTQLAARLGLTGQEYYQAANTSTDGLGLVLGVNRLNNRQLWLGDTAALAQNSTNSIIRLTVGGTATPTIDAIATDGTTTKALALGNAGGVQYGKATVALGAGATATLGTIGGSGPTVAGQNSWVQMKDSTGADVWVPVWK